jgi:hypothetical protein
MAAFRVNLAAYSKDTCGSFVTDMAEKLVDEPKNSDKESSWRFSHEQIPLLQEAAGRRVAVNSGLTFYCVELPCSVTAGPRAVGSSSRPVERIHN